MSEITTNIEYLKKGYQNKGNEPEISITKKIDRKLNMLKLSQGFYVAYKKFIDYKSSKV